MKFRICFCVSGSGILSSNQNYIEIQNFERLADIIKKDYPTFSGLALEMYFRQQMMESKEFADIGSWWQGRNNKDQDEIDIVGLYAEEKKSSGGRGEKTIQKISSRICLRSK